MKNIEFVLMIMAAVATTVVWSYSTFATTDSLREQKEDIYDVLDEIRCDVKQIRGFQCSSRKKH